ncbi:MAG: hypothetical protein SGPRY_014914, partial [Prymnesium sp.]
MQVVVGNIKVEDQMWDVCFSLVVNNMVRGAYGAALLMAEYYLYLKSHPAACEQLLTTQPSQLEASYHSDYSHPTPSLPATPPELELNSSSLEPLNNSLISAAAVNNAKARCHADPGGYHGEIACRLLHWYHPGLRAWLSWEPSLGVWRGWHVSTEGRELAEAWSPWEVAFSQQKAPYYEWFVGGLTSAAFNEVDRHVLEGH